MRRPSRLLSSLALVLAVTACGAEPTSVPFTMALEARAAKGVVREDPEGPSIDCDVQLRATTTGAGRALWEGGVFRWYAGIDRLTPVDSQPLTRDDVVELWGGPAIDGNTVRAVDWVFWAGVPFELEVELRYAPEGGGAPGSAKARFACGLVPPPDGAPAPTITSVTVTPSEGEITRGDLITVRYEAQSPLGLWATAIVVTGPFEAEHVFTESMRTSTVRTHTFAVPGGLRSGVPLAVAVIADDGALQRTLYRRPVATQFVDRSPPVLEQAGFALGWGTLRGQFPADATLDIWATARDDNALGWMIVEYGSPVSRRDSVPIPAGIAATNSWTTSLALQPEWTGALDIAVHVRDAAGNASGTIRSEPGAISVYPVVTRPASAVVAAPGGPISGFRDLIWDERRGRVFLTQVGSGSVAVLDPASMTLASPIAFPHPARGIDLSVSGDSLLVAMTDARAIGVADLAGDTSVATVPLTVLDTAGAAREGEVPRPIGVQVAANGTALVVLDRPTRSRSQLAYVDLATGAQRLHAGLEFAGYSAGMLGSFGRAPDRSRVFMLGNAICPVSYLAATGALSGCGDYLGGSPLQMTASRDGTRLGVANAIRDGNLRIVRVMTEVVREISEAAVSADGTLAYLASRQHVYIVRIADGKILERFSLPFPALRLVPSPDGRSLLALDAVPAGRIVRIDLQ